MRVTAPALCTLAVGLLLGGTGCGGGVKRISSPPLGAASPGASPDGSPDSSAGVGVNAEAREAFLSGRLLLLAGELDEARAALERARRFDPASGAILVALGEVALARTGGAGGGPVVALALWEEAVALPESAWGRSEELGRAWLKVARLRRVSGDIEGARAAYGEATDRLPEAHRAWAERVELLELLGASDAAAAVVAEWVGVDLDEDREALRMRGFARQAVGDAAGALSDLDTYLELQPDDPLVLDLYLLQAERMERRRSALRRLTAAWRAVPADVEVLRRLAGYCEQLGHSPRLLEALDALDRMIPTEERAKLAVDRARVRLGMGRPADALEVLEVAEHGDPWADLLRARALLDLGRTGQARTLLDGLSAPPAALGLHAAMLREAGAVEGAGAVVAAALAERPQGRQALRAGVVHAAATGALDEARALLARRLDLPAADREPALARLLAGQGETDAAIALIEAWLAQAPEGGDRGEGDRGAALRDLGALRMQGDPAAAAEALEAALALDPTDDDARYLLASARWEQGDRGGARALARDLLTRQPGHAAAGNLVAWSLVAPGETPDAVEVAEAVQLARGAVERVPASAAYLDTLAWGLARQGDQREALPLLVEAQRLAPDNVEIAEHLAALRDGAGPPVVLPATP